MAILKVYLLTELKSRFTQDERRGHKPGIIGERVDFSLPCLGPVTRGKQRERNTESDSPDIKEEIS